MLSRESLSNEQRDSSGRPADSAAPLPVLSFALNFISGRGLLSMRERAVSVGGDLRVKSVRRAGTEIEVCIPLPPKGSSG